MPRLDRELFLGTKILEKRKNEEMVMDFGGHGAKVRSVDHDMSIMICRIDYTDGAALCSDLPPDWRMLATWE
jgi:hypothetical protein